MCSFHGGGHGADVGPFQGAIQQSEGDPVPDPLRLRAELQFGEMRYSLRVLSLQNTLKTSTAQDDTQ
jgi:hypothetical protein